MQIKIGKKAYPPIPAMITLIRYYVEFRESFLAAYLSGACGAPGSGALGLVEH